MHDQVQKSSVSDLISVNVSGLGSPRFEDNKMIGLIRVPVSKNHYPRGVFGFKNDFQEIVF